MNYTILYTNMHAFSKKKQLMCDIEFVFIKKLLTIVVRAQWIPLAKPFTA